MFRHDMIMEQVERLTRALAEVATKRKAGKLSEAEQELARTTEDLVGMRPEGLLMLDPSALVEMVEGGNGPDRQRGVGLARLLAEYGHLSRAIEQPQRARQAFMQAFCLYDELDRALGLREEEALGMEIDALMAELEG